MDITANITEENIKPYFSASQIIKFYEGKSIFITGVTGFLGTVLIEKLLYTCRRIKNIYILMKQKRGNSIDNRLAQMLDSPAFHRVREHCPEAMKKIIPIEGNLMEPNLGMSDYNVRLLQREVSVVFHLAAKISFNMDIAKSLNSNTKSTEMLLNICKDMPQLAAFVYASSGYSQSNRVIVDEVFYEPSVSIEEVYEMLDIPGSKMAVRGLLEGRPNTYTYSKALSEITIKKHADQIPSAIVRPTQVISAVKEPHPGWITSWAGPTRIVEAAGRGLWMVWYSDPSEILDVVPVDYVANLMIAAAWDTHNRQLKQKLQKDKMPRIFNYSSCVQNPIDNKTFIETCLKKNRKTVGKKALFTNRLFLFIQNYIWYCVAHFFIQIVFINTILFIIDCAFWLVGQDKKLLKMQKAIEKLASVVQLFTRMPILFLNRNTRRLYQSMNKTDQKLFVFDISHLKWENYLQDYVSGVKNYNVFAE